MMYETREIKIATTNEEGEACMIEQEATVALGTGLAYLPYDCSGGGQQVIHLATGMKVGGDWIADDEEEARIWIANLDRIMDWSKDRPKVRQEEKAMMAWLAIIGALQQHELPE